MGKPYSLDLRKRIIGFIEGGDSRRSAADRFGVSPSCAIKLMDRFRRTGSAAPGRQGGSVGKLAAYKDFLLGRVKEKPDITMPELAEALKVETGTEAAPASLSPFLIRHGQRFKKTLLASEQNRPDIARQRDEWTKLRLPRMRLEPHRLVFIDERARQPR